MENKVKVRFAALGLLGLACVALDLAAEATKMKLGHRGKNCVLISGSFFDPYFEALSAAIILCIAQSIIAVSTEICPFLRMSPHLRFLSCLSFLTFIGRQLYHYFYLFHISYKCTVPRRGTWAGAAILSLANVVIGMTYSYYDLLSAKNSNAPQIEIAMGQTIPSTVTQDPVFVHEDTFMRRQFP